MEILFAAMENICLANLFCFYKSVAIKKTFVMIADCKKLREVDVHCF